MQVLNSANTNTDVLAVLQALASDPEVVKARLADLQRATEINKKILEDLYAKTAEVQKGERQNKRDLKLLADEQEKLKAEKLAFETSKLSVLKGFAEQEAAIVKKLDEANTTFKLAQQTLANFTEKEKKAENDLAFAKDMMKKADDKAATADALFQRLTKAISG